MCTKRITLCKKNNIIIIIFISLFPPKLECICRVAYLTVSAYNLYVQQPHCTSCTLTFFIVRFDRFWSYDDREFPFLYYLSKNNKKSTSSGMHVSFRISFNVNFINMSENYLLISKLYDKYILQANCSQRVTKLETTPKVVS